MWSSSGGGVGATGPGGWEEVRAHEEDFITGPRNGSALEFVLERSAGMIGGEGESEVEVALDAVGLEFCLPCDFEDLTSEGEHVF